MLIDTIETNATIGTSEYSMGLASTSGAPTALTVAALCTLVVDGNALAAGDEFLIQVYEKAISGGTQRVAQRITLMGTMLVDMWDLGLLKNGYDVTVKKIAGTDRAIPMSLRRAQATATADITSILAFVTKPTGTAVTGTLTATAFSTNLGAATVDKWKNCLIKFTSGALINQVQKVTASDASSGLTFATGFTGAPSNGDAFIVINV